MLGDDRWDDPNSMGVDATGEVSRRQFPHPADAHHQYVPVHIPSDQY